jgi:hypothetical protein
MAVNSCKQCGREVASSARWCPDCGTPLGKTVRCRSCGNEISIWSKACHRCGAAGAAAFGPITYVMFIGGVLILLSIFGVVAYFFHKQHEKDVKEMHEQHQRNIQQMEQQQKEWQKKHGF